MTDVHGHLDPVEDALLAHDDADRAGVFRVTPVNADDLFGGPVVVRSPRLVFRAGVAVAATIVLAVGVWSWLFQMELSRLRSAAITGNSVALQSDALPVRCDACISECVTGPVPNKPADCDRYDYDADGDVDLADFSRYQLAYAGPVR